MKVVINIDVHGTFSLSDIAIQKFVELSGYNFDAAKVYRHNNFLIQTVENLGNKANTKNSELRIVEIPDNIDYIIVNNHGEYVKENVCHCPTCKCSREWHPNWVEEYRAKFTS